MNLLFYYMNSKVNIKNQYLILMSFDFDLVDKYFSYQTLRYYKLSTN